MYSCSIHYTRMIVKFVPAGLLEGGGGGGWGVTYMGEPTPVQFTLY